MTELDNSLFTYLESVETAETFSADQLVLNSQIIKLEKEGKITIKDGQDIETNKVKSFFAKALSRENILYLGKYIQETPIEISEAQGFFALPILDMNQINRKLEKIPKKHSGKIAWIHISTLQIIVKASFLKGIDSPITIIVIDRRIKDPKKSIIGAIEGNLKFSIVKFNVSLQYALSLLSPDLETAVGIQFRFHDQELMDKGQIPFSITYATGYALSNSHHSIQFANKDKIYVDDVFEQTSTKRIIIRNDNKEYESLSNKLVPARKTIKEIGESSSSFEEKIDQIQKQVAILQKKI